MRLPQPLSTTFSTEVDCTSTVSSELQSDRSICLSAGHDVIGERAKRPRRGQFLASHTGDSRQRETELEASAGHGMSDASTPKPVRWARRLSVRDWRADGRVLCTHCTTSFVRFMGDSLTSSAANSSFAAADPDVVNSLL